jgi:hypothetical protein
MQYSRPLDFAEVAPHQLLVMGTLHEFGLSAQGAGRNSLIDDPVGRANSPYRATALHDLLKLWIAQLASRCLLRQRPRVGLS